MRRIGAVAHSGGVTIVVFIWNKKNGELPIKVTPLFIDLLRWFNADLYRIPTTGRDLQHTS